MELRTLSISSGHNDDNFKASFGLLNKLIPITGEELSSNEAAVDQFKNWLRIKNEAIQSYRDQIYNADENGPF